LRNIFATASMPRSKTSAKYTYAMLLCGEARARGSSRHKENLRDIKGGKKIVKQVPTKDERNGGRQSNSQKKGGRELTRRGTLRFCKKQDGSPIVLLSTKEEPILSLELIQVEVDWVREVA